MKVGTIVHHIQSSGLIYLDFLIEAYIFITNSLMNSHVVGLKLFSIIMHTLLAGQFLSPEDLLRRETQSHVKIGFLSKKIGNDE